MSRNVSSEKSESILILVVGTVSGVASFRGGLSLVSYSGYRYAVMFGFSVIFFALAVSAVYDLVKSTDANHGHNIIPEIIATLRRRKGAISVDNKSQSEQTNKRNAKGCLVTILLFIVLVFAVKSCLFGGESKPDAPSPPDNVLVYVHSQNIIEEYLRAPSTAKFPLSTEAQIEKYSDYKYKVTAYVDAQNTFGAMIRNNYSVIITYNDDWTKYGYDSVMIDGEQYK